MSTQLKPEMIIDGDYLVNTESGPGGTIKDDKGARS